MLPSDWPNTKVFDFESCETDEPLLPKVNKGGAADIVVAELFDILVAVLLKPDVVALIDVEVVLTGNIIVLGDDKLDVVV